METTWGMSLMDFSADDLVVAKQRLASDEARYSTREVLAYLRSLEKE